MASTRLWYLSIIKEATTATAVKPTHFLRYKDWDIKVTQEIIENNPIQNNRWNAISAVPWKKTVEWSYNFDLDANECVYFLTGALGWFATSDIWSTPWQVYQHVLTTANTLPSYTMEQGKWNLTDSTNNLQNYQVDRLFWTLIDSVKLTWSDALVNMEVTLKSHWAFQRSLLIANATAGSSVALSLESVEWLVATVDTVNIYDNTPANETDAIASISTSNKTITIATLWWSYAVSKLAKVELVPQTPAYSVVPKVMSFIHADFKFWTDLTAAASATEENIEDWSFEYMNNLEERFWSLRSSPSVIAPKWANAKLTFSKYFESVIDRDRYLAQTKRAGILTITNNEIIWAWDSNNFKYTIKIEMSDIRFTSYEMPTGTDELYAISCECACFYDSSDARAVRITVLNSTVWTTYSA